MEDELIKILEKEIRLEIDRQIIDGMIDSMLKNRITILAWYAENYSDKFITKNYNIFQEYCIKRTMYESSLKYKLAIIHGE